VAAGDDAKKIKIAYYKLAQKYHPDKQGSNSKPKEAEEKFKAISYAYELIKDEDAKKKYDKAKDDFKNPK
jgi:DnaJ-class molecular chaperone